MLRRLEVRILRTPALPRVDWQLDAFLAVLLHAHGVQIDVARAHLLTAVALRNYAFDPDENHAWRKVVANREWDAQDLVVDNFGAFETLGELTGYEPRAYRAISGSEQLLLAEFELKGGRPLLAYMDDGSLGVVVSHTSPRGTLRADVEALGDEVRTLVWETIEEMNTKTSSIQTLIAVRPYDDRGPLSRRHALQIEALRYARVHTRNMREMWAAGDALVSTGLRAWDTRIDLLRRRWNEADADGLVWWQQHIEQLARARKHAATALLAWAAAEEGDEDWAPLEQRAGLAVVGACYAQQAVHLAELVEAPVSTAEERNQVADVLAALRTLDIQAVDALDTVLPTSNTLFFG